MALLTESWIIDNLLLLIAGLTVVYYILSRKYTYWERNGFKTLTLPEFSYIFGHFKKLFIDRLCFGDFVRYLYTSADGEPFIGLYGFWRPILFIRDPELIQSILIKDFSYFTDRK